MIRGDGARRPGSGSLAFVWLAALCLWPPQEAVATVARVNSLGGEAALILDATNLFRYPSLARTLAHADVELFDDWAGASVPVGEHTALGLFLNRPADPIDRLTDYIQTTGSPTFRSLELTPWIDAVASTQLTSGLHLGAAVRLAHDQQRVDAADAAATLRQFVVGLSVAPGSGRGLDASVRLDDIRLQDDDIGTTAEETDGGGLAVDVRIRWSLRPGIVALPWLSWQRTKAGLSPQARERTQTQAGLGINARLRPGAMLAAGLVMGAEEEEIHSGENLLQRRRHLQLPTVTGGVEIQAGKLALRLGLRHETGWIETHSPVGQEESFHTGLTSHLGLGFEVGDVVVDGLLRKGLLLDGPYLLTGNADDGGLFTSLSVAYRLFD